jgi:hypothetical protein
MSYVFSGQLSAYLFLGSRQLPLKGFITEENKEKRFFIKT